MRSHRRLRASLYQLGASATNSVQSLHAANWALRMVLSGVQNDLLSQDADLFLRSVGPFLLWSRAGMRASSSASAAIRSASPVWPR